MASAAFEDIAETFAFLDDLEDRYRHVIEIGRAMAPMDPALHTPAARVEGCASQVWMVPRIEGRGPGARFDFAGDSDALIVRGLVAVLHALYSGLSVAEVGAAHPWFAEKLAAGEDFRRSETGETATEAGERIAGVLAEVVQRRPGETIVVVGHGLALRVGTALTLGLGFAGSYALSGLWNCSWTILEHAARWRLLTYNAVASPRSD